MKASAVSKYLAEIGRKGGKARLTKMTPEQRREIATKASKAAAKARSQKARKKRLALGRRTGD